MTSHSHAVIFSDIEIISLENIINEQIKIFKDAHGDSLSVPYRWSDILNKLKNSQTELATWTSFDLDGKPTINIKSD